MSKGWFLESRRHKLSALGIKTGRKILPNKPVSLIVGDQSLFYPKSANEIKLDKTVKELVALTLPEKKKKKKSFISSLFKKHKKTYFERGMEDVFEGVKN